MSQQNKTALQQSINTQLADNSAGEISAADVRSNMINITDSLVFNNEDQNIVGSIELTGDVTASVLSGSFVGDGSGLTNITTEWDGSHNGDAEITGSLNISGASKDLTVENGNLIVEAGNITFGVGGTAEVAIQNITTGGVPSMALRNQIYLADSGRVGINNAIPTTTLDVLGGCKVSGTTILNSTTGSSFTGSFVGDGSGLTDLPAANAFPYTGVAEITGSLTVSGSGDTNILNGLNIFGDTPSAESCRTAYTNGRVLTDWTDLNAGFANTAIDAGNITITSDFTDYISLRNNGTVKALSRENGLRSTRLTFETGTITNDSVVTVPKDVTGTLALELKGYTVSTLPTGAVGDRAYVTDALAPAFLVLVTGGGAITSPVFHNGTIWVCG
jgi:hypothetical protein